MSDTQTSDYPEPVNLNDVIVHHDDKFFSAIPETFSRIPDWPFDSLSKLGNADDLAGYFDNVIRPKMEGSPVEPIGEEETAESVEKEADAAFNELIAAFSKYMQLLGRKFAFKAQRELGYNK